LSRRWTKWISQRSRRAAWRGRRSLRTPSVDDRGGAPRFRRKSSTAERNASFHDIQPVAIDVAAVAGGPPRSWDGDVDYNVQPLRRRSRAEDAPWLRHSGPCTESRARPVASVCSFARRAASRPSVKPPSAAGPPSTHRSVFGRLPPARLVVATVSRAVFADLDSQRCVPSGRSRVGHVSSDASGPLFKRP
jgi:hypothetical protein